MVSTESTKAKKLIVRLSLLTLASCGGGDDADSEPPSPGSDFDAAYADYAESCQTNVRAKQDCGLTLNGMPYDVSWWCPDDRADAIERFAQNPNVTLRGLECVSVATQADTDCLVVLGCDEAQCSSAYVDAYDTCVRESPDAGE